MKFLCLCHYEPARFAALSESDRQALGDRCRPHDEALRASGRLIMVGSLAEPPSSRTVRPGNGGPSVSDGPYAATDEPVGAFFIIEAGDMDEALAVEAPGRAPGRILRQRDRGAADRHARSAAGRRLVSVRYRGRIDIMIKRPLIALVVALAVAPALPAPAAEAQSGYASVNGLEMYYEIHGEGPPLVVLHGALMALENFGELLPALAKDRQVIAIEQQAHGRTADIDRPFSYEQMADDTAGLLRQLEIEQADFFGYSMGATTTLQVAIRHPELVRKQVLAAPAYQPEGLYPEVLENISSLKPEDFAGSPWLEAYARVAPNPDDWPTLLAKVRQLVGEFEDWRAEEVRAIEAPALVVVGDADVVRPEHAVELFRLLGGGVPGDVAGLPRARLAVLPGTTHVGLADRVDWLTPMVGEFLDAPMPKAK